jgi:hypothetical protein
MTDLSPATQAVLDALYMEELNGPQQLMARAHAAAALRAAADEVCLRWAELEHPADVLNAIAAELEAQ